MTTDCSTDFNSRGRAIAVLTAVAVIAVGMSRLPVFAVETIEGTSRPSAFATLDGRQLTVSATDRPGEIEVMSEGDWLPVARLPKNLRITELRACKWEQGGLPPGLAVAIEALLSDQRHVYFWATLSPSSEGRFELKGSPTS